MTQKRFKKLMMSKGYSRNGVNEIAKKARESGRTYAEVYTISSNIDISAAVDAFQNAIKKIQEVCIAAGAAIRAFNETFNKAMKSEGGQ